MSWKLFTAILVLIAQVMDSVLVCYLFVLMYRYYHAGDKPALFLFSVMAAGIWCISMSMYELKRNTKKG